MSSALICTISVPGSIVPWGRARLGKGVHFTAPKVRNYQAVLRDYAHQAMAGQPPHDGACRVSMEARYPWPTTWSAKRRLREGIHKRSKPDADNLIKQLDALSGVVFTDDARLADVRVVKIHDDAPGLTVCVWSLLAEDAYDREHGLSRETLREAVDRNGSMFRQREPLRAAE